MEHFFLVCNEMVLITHIFMALHDNINHTISGICRKRNPTRLGYRGPTLLKAVQKL